MGEIQADVLDKFESLFSVLSEQRGERSERVRQLDSRLDEIMDDLSGDRVAAYRHFALFIHSRTLSENEGYLMTYVSGRLRTRFSISTSDIIDAGLPLYLSRASDEKKVGRFCLDVASQDGKLLIPLVNYAKARKKDDSASQMALFDFMFQSHPAHALSAIRAFSDLSIERVDEIKEIESRLEGDIRFGATSALRGGREETPILELLQTMSAAPEWWVRLCVAETMRKIPSLQIPSVVEKLRLDENHLVRESIDGLDAWADRNGSPPRHRVDIDVEEKEN